MLSAIRENQNAHVQAAKINGLFERAKIHYQMGNLDIALRDINHVIGSDPENVTAYFLRPLTRKRLGRAADARQDFYRACELKHVIACMG